ncbi:MAG TPA: hypothetical protein PLH19_12100 [Anaerolineae bacterium]|nr:hypothetical protein [Anaerolineae bacterium]HQH39259.1 hypothetical protein [Anaerolineae bacterium]
MARLGQAVGANLNNTRTIVDGVTVYNGALYLATTPATETFTADVTLSYTSEELAVSDISDAASTYLARWTGSAWEACPEADRARDVTACTVTGLEVAKFSTWAIAGEGASPTRLRILAVRFVVESWPGALLLLLACVAVHQTSQARSKDHRKGG